MVLAKLFTGKATEGGGMEEANEGSAAGVQSFDPSEMDKLIRQIVDKVRGNYFQNGESGRGIPGEVKRIIENSIDRI